MLALGAGELEPGMLETCMNPEELGGGGGGGGQGVLTKPPRKSSYIGFHSN